MATQHVKILVRRGLREQLSSDVLDTGEFGFTTDTNQLFIGIDPAINEIQFDPFINAHAIIQSWLDSDDCPFPGLTVDEDLVIRHIPTTYEEDGTPISGVELLLERMHFFTQNVELVGNLNATANDVLYQRRFVYADEETSVDDLTKKRTYKILEMNSDSNDFLNNVSGNVGQEFSKYDNFTVRNDFDIVPVPADIVIPETLRVVEVVDTEEHTSGVIMQLSNLDGGINKIIVKLREGYPEFIQDAPYINNYYHFNGNADGNLKSDFGLFKYENNEWIKKSVIIIDEENYINGIETVTHNGIEIDKPKHELFNDDITQEIYAVVTKSSKLTYWKKIGIDDWKLLGSGDNDFQFSAKPPVDFEIKDGDTKIPVDKLDTRSNGDNLESGDLYVYTDKDIFGGTKLNIFEWSQEDHMYHHNTVPVFYSDSDAVEFSATNTLLFALPYETESVGILELKQRDYDTSKFWYPYEYDNILSYYFTTNPVPNLAEEDLVYARSIEGKSEFSVGYLGRSRRNVEVVTENTFNQLFADQHLSAQEAYSGVRPSLFRKTFIDNTGVFLKYNKNLNSTFFVDYSLKQITGSRTFLRVGTLRIINGYPHKIPEIKLTDENTEIWHDNVILDNDVTMGDGDRIEDYDEFSNIIFETAIEVDGDGEETDNLLIIYKQEPMSSTEVSYTIKRWTM